MKKFDERTEYILTQLGLAIESKDWETVSSLITLNPETMALALECTYNHLPDEYKFSIPTECYTHHGDSMPTVRKYVRVARKFMPDAKRIPTEFLSMQEIQVYRAGEEEIGKAVLTALPGCLRKHPEVFFFMFQGNGLKFNHLVRSHNQVPIR